MVMSGLVGCWLQRQQYFIIWLSVLKPLQLEKFTVGKHHLSRGRSAGSHGALDHGLNLSWNITLSLMRRYLSVH